MPLNIVLLPFLIREFRGNKPLITASTSAERRKILAGCLATGLLLFGGEGHMTDPATDDPESSARLIVHRMLARFGSQTGLLGSGRIGVNWELHEEKGARFYLVREIRSGLPAEKAGIKVGDKVLACNGSPLTAVKTDREAKRLCQVEAGQILQLQLRRSDQPLEVSVTAEQRPGL